MLGAERIHPCLPAGKASSLSLPPSDVPFPNVPAGPYRRYSPTSPSRYNPPNPLIPETNSRSAHPRNFVRSEKRTNLPKMGFLIMGGYGNY